MRADAYAKLSHSCRLGDVLWNFWTGPPSTQRSGGGGGGGGARGIAAAAHVLSAPRVTSFYAELDTVGACVRACAAADVSSGAHARRSLSGRHRPSTATATATVVA